MKKLQLLLAILAFCGLSYKSTATHIVGGYISTAHITNDSFNISLNLFIDEVLVHPDAIGSSISVYLVSNSTRCPVETIELELAGELDIDINNYCLTFENEQFQLIYTLNRRFPSDIYSDPNGYTLVFDRCCRNNNIVNLDDSNLVGQVLYQETRFWENGEVFINHSPVFEYGVKEVICLNKNYNSNEFQAYDADGDSLVYRFAKPIKGFSNQSTPILENGYCFESDTTIAPFTPFQEGYDAQHPFGIASEVNITEHGVFSANVMAAEGIYALTVVCEEYRNGQKIGEVIYDTHKRVINCSVVTDVSIEIPTNDWTFLEGATIEYELEKLNSSICIPISIMPSSLNDTLSFKFNTYLSEKATFAYTVTNQEGEPVEKAIINESQGFDGFLCIEPTCHFSNEKVGFIFGYTLPNCNDTRQLFSGFILNVGEQNQLNPPRAVDVIWSGSSLFDIATKDSLGCAASASLLSTQQINIQATVITENVSEANAQFLLYHGDELVHSTQNEDINIENNEAVFSFNHTLLADLDTNKVLKLILAARYTSNNSACFSIVNEESCLILSLPTEPNGLSDELAEKVGFQCYPNPSEGKFQLSYNLKRPAQIGYILKSIDGKELLVEKAQNTAAGKHSMEVNTGQLPSGLYLLQFMINDEWFTQKVFLNR